jgi:phosphoribosylformylglycinamidine cyclo-ligase
MDYRQAGVDIDAGNETVRRIKSLARSTFTPGVLSDIGSFGGLFRLDLNRYRDPVLVSSADGVGTKLKVAFMTGRHDTIGADLVNHCVNDILVQGAEPLFFLDYLATGRLSPETAEQIVSGVSRGCRENGCALIGGETAEMPGFYADGEYDLAGFIVGAVDRSAIVDGRSIGAGDVVIGLPASGLHTNGYSLARRVFFDVAGWSPETFVPELGSTLADALLAPHRSYLGLVRPVLEARLAKGLAHITGGGITDNLPRILPEGCAAEVDRRGWTVPPIFELLRQLGGIPGDDMYRTFNMGIGFIIVCQPSVEEQVLGTLAEAGERHAVRIGRVVSGDRDVAYV